MPLDSLLTLSPLHRRGILAHLTGIRLFVISFAGLITVGAIDNNRTPGYWADDVLPNWSATGPTLDGFAKPDILAPGVGEVGKSSKSGSLFRLYPQLLYNDDDGDDLDPVYVLRLPGIDELDRDGRIGTLAEYPGDVVEIEGYGTFQVVN